MGKVKKFLSGAKRKVATVATAACLTVGGAMTAFASEGTQTVSQTMSTTLQTSLNQMANDFVGYIGVVLPIGLTVFAATWGIKKAKAFFKNMANG